MKNIFLVLGAFLFGLLISYLIDMFEVEKPLFGYDHNEDGISDEVYIYKNNVMTKLEIDRNFDGKIDFKLNFLPTGHLKTSESDDNFDGTFETSMSYFNNQLDSVRVDSNGDGKKDFIGEFKYGLLFLAYIINPKTQLKQKITEYKFGKIIKSQEDIDGDGHYEITCVYDFYESGRCQDQSRQ